MYTRFKKWLQRVLGILGIYGDMEYEIGRRLKLEGKVAVLEQKLETLSSAFLPVVLIKADEVMEDGTSFQSCMYIQAKSHDTIVRLTYSAYSGVKDLKSVILLNGPYSVTDIIIGHMSVVIDEMIPAGVEKLIPKSLGRFCVGNQITIMLAKV